MNGLLTFLALLIGAPLCAIVVIAGVWEYPYLIVIPIGAVYLVRRPYRRVNATFQRDVAAERARLPRVEQNRLPV